MKKFLPKAICAFMALVLATSASAIPVFANVSKDGECTVSDYSSSSPADNAIAYLKMLGIADISDASAPVTRGQAVSSVIRAIGNEALALQSAGSMYTYDEKMAFVAYQCGILSGNSPSEWNLDSRVTNEQLSKMLVVALGYGAIITNPNAYPAEYLGYAARLGLNKGTSEAQSAAVSGGDFAIISEGINVF